MDNELPKFIYFCKGRLLLKRHPRRYSCFTGKIILDCGYEYHLKNGYLHSEKDMPSMITKNSYRWYHYGKLHRTVLDKEGRQKPAIICSKGSRRYYINGKLHRNPDPDGTQPPAVIDVRGTRKWYYKGKKHRIDAPAVVYKNGDYEWYKNGKLDRVDDGPAIYYTDPKNIAQWSIRRFFYQCIHRSVLKVNSYCEWRKKGKIYREKYPAVIMDKCFEIYCSDEKSGIIFYDDFEIKDIPYHLRHLKR
jgi:hypothetical protein